MKQILLLLAVLPGLTGCLATGTVIALGRKSEFKFHVDEVRRANSGPSYLVDYTATVGLSTIGGGHFDQKRFQILTPGQPPPPRLKVEPDGFQPPRVVPLQRVASPDQVGGLPAGQLARAFVMDKETIVLLARDAPSSPVVRTDFAFCPLDYREPYAYPVMVIGLPVAVVIDTATFPFQVLLMASAFNHPDSRPAPVTR